MDRTPGRSAARRAPRRPLLALLAALLILGPAMAPTAPAVAAGTLDPVHAYRVKDVQPGAVASEPSELTSMNGTLYFVADDGVHGRELWRTNGNAAGTRMVVNITGDATGSSPSGLTGLGGILYFTANDGVHGRELWRSDGTAGGTWMVHDIRPGGSSSPGNLTAGGGPGGGVLYFNANDGVHGRELWRSDGTGAGTGMVADIAPGAAESSPQSLFAHGLHLYFSADDGTHGRELWRTDGTEAGTELVRDIHAVPVATGSFPSQFVSFQGMPHFRARSQNVGFEVWRTDGTQAGTQPVTDIVLGPPSSDPQELTVFDGRLYFSADDGLHGRELWYSEGGTAVDELWDVFDINPGLTGSDPARLTVAGDFLFFTADDGTHGRELWRTDGTVAGTQVVVDLRPGGQSEPAQLTALGDLLYFTADDGVHGRELWRTDGTKAGTELVANLRADDSASPRRLTSARNSLYFTADDGVSGEELWRLAALPEAGVVRYGGVNRFATAALLSAGTFEPGVGDVFVATGDDFPDALTGAVAAARDRAPVLLVRRASIPEETHDELTRLQPQRIWILGGQGAVSTGVEAQLAAFTAGPVERLAGPERFSTAVAVSQQQFPDGADVVYVSTGFNFPDALSGVPAAAAVPGPLLLVTTNQLTSPTEAELVRLAPERAVILGGAGAVSLAVEQALGQHAATVERVAGPDRYATAGEIAEEAFPEAAAVHTVFVATGIAFPDALAAGAVAGSLPGPVLLSRRDVLPPPTVARLQRFAPHRIVIMGGTAAVSEAVEQQLGTYLTE